MTSGVGPLGVTNWEWSTLSSQHRGDQWLQVFCAKVAYVLSFMKIGHHPANEIYSTGGRLSGLVAGQVGCWLVFVRFEDQLSQSNSSKNGKMG